MSLSAALIEDRLTMVSGLIPGNDERKSIAKGMESVATERELESGWS